MITLWTECDIGNANLGAGRLCEAACTGEALSFRRQWLGAQNLPAHLSPVALQDLERVFRRITCPRPQRWGRHAAGPGVSEVGCTRTCLGITLEIPEEGCGPPSL